ncbi:MAG: hypothetical protein IJS61_05725 [Firmicutes bacterium]|nr:hypothetical protein [Bacillota bacterium]
MSKFFNNLVNIGLLNDWATILDWLFDDNKFDSKKWSSGYVGSFSKKIKKFDYIGKNNFIYDKRDNILFQNTIDKENPIIIKMIRGDSAGKDFVRHIRNGIAHGCNSFHVIKEKTYIKILDYNRKKEQTAYIIIPIEYIEQLYNIYASIEQQIIFNTKKKKNTTKNKKRFKKILIRLHTKMELGFVLH